MQGYLIKIKVNLSIQLPIYFNPLSPPPPQNNTSKVPSTFISIDLSQNLKHKDSFGKSENLSKIFFRRNSSIWSWLWRQVIEQ